MSEQIGNTMPVPGFTQYEEVTDDELLASTAGFTQRGGVLEGGQGIIPLGTPLGRKTSNKKWVVYNNAGSGGAEVARAILRQTTDTGVGETSKDCFGNLVLAGHLKYSKMSGADAAAITDLNARVDTVLDLFQF